LGDANHRYLHATSPEGLQGQGLSLDRLHGVCSRGGQGPLPFRGRDARLWAQGRIRLPSWLRYGLEADEQAVLFSFSDRPVQQALDLWREAF